MDFVSELAAQRVMAIVRGSDPGASLRCLAVLREEGIALAEVSLSGAGALEVIRMARQEFGPEAPLGAGTVLTREDARAATEAGASFLVSPALTEGVVDAAASGTPVLPGALTPSEIFSAHRLAAGPVKLFPAGVMGPAYVKALAGPYPGLSLVAVGGVGIGDAAAFLDAGALALGVGSPLIGDAADGGDIRALRDRARALVEAVAAAERVG